MDQIFVQLNLLPDASVGDEVVLLGTQAENSLQQRRLLIGGGR